MCGIAGIINASSDEPNSRETLEALAWREFDIGRQGRRLCEFIEELRAKKLRRCVGNGRAGF